MFGKTKDYESNQRVLNDDLYKRFLYNGANVSRYMYNKLFDIPN